MEPTRKPASDITSGRPQLRTSPQPNRRPLMDDFAPRPSQHQPGPAQPARPFAAPATPATQPAHHSLRPGPRPVQTEDTQPSAAPAKEPHEPRSRGGLVGLIVFVVLAGLFLSPLLPGHVFKSFPGSSQSFESGQQGLACINPLSRIQTTSTSTKSGFPISYTYSSLSTQHASCDGKALSAPAATVSNANPVGGIVDVLLALMVGVGVARVWNRLRNR